jgi:uncharacterized protein YaaR (DUF327 family)
MKRNITRRNKKYSNQKTGNVKIVNLHNPITIAFHKEIVKVFLETLIMVKLFHWKTSSFAIHKATDEFYEKLNKNMDQFIEILLGKTMSRIDLTHNKNIHLDDVKSTIDFKNKLQSFKNYLLRLNENKAMQTMINTDLFNIRDTIVGDTNQLLYLLTLV